MLMPKQEQKERGLPSPSQKDLLEKLENREPNILLAKKFFDANRSFFVYPIENQEEFRAFFEKKEALEQLQDYSEKFMTVLNSKEGRIKRVVANSKNEFVRMGTDRAFTVWTDDPDKQFQIKANSDNQLEKIPGSDKQFETVLGLEIVQKFLKENDEHPALELWREAQYENQPILKAMRDILLEGSKQLADYESKLEKRIERTEQTRENILHLQQAREKIGNEIINLDLLNSTLKGNDNKEIILENLCAPILKNLSEIMLNNLSKIQREPAIRGFAEIIWDKIMSVFERNYKSQSTIETEKHNSDFGNLRENFTDRFKNEMTKLKKLDEVQSIGNKMSALKEKDVSHEESSKYNNSESRSPKYK